jgi:starch phosphorylase
MNDTHPTIAVAELMRLLIDAEGLDWDSAWSITTQVPFPHSRPSTQNTALDARLIPLRIL